jgi:type I restriction enzyme S subunit
MSKVMHPPSAHLVDRALTDLLSFIVDNRGRTCPVKDSGFPLIATNCIKPGQREAVFENVRYVDDETYARWFRAHPLPGDVIFVCKGSPGRVAVVPEPVPYCIAQDMVALRADTNVIDPAYLYYRLSAPDVQAKIRNMHVGTLIPHFKKGDFGHLRFSVHENLDEQRQIANTLGTLDDLIDTNRQLARQLDSCLVASWSALARRCHTERVLSELVDLRKGVSYKGTFLAEHGLPLINLANFALDGSFKESGTKHYLGPVKDRQLLSKGSLVVANTDLTQRCEILARPLLVPFQAATSTHHTFQVDVRGSDARRGWIFCALRTEVIRRRLVSFATGTTVAALPADALLSQEIPWASGQVIDSWWSKASALREAQESVAAEARELERGRDEVLPLLMSGRVRVEEVSV